MTTADFSARRAAFRKLHNSGCFVIPNPWDVGSARLLASLGFKALASTSSGFAWSRGRRDNAVGVEEVLAHCRELVAATDLPVNADFEDGHATTLHELADNVRRLITTGVAGFSIEDARGHQLYDLETAVARLGCAREAINASGADVMLIGRAECFLTGHPQPLDEARRRLVAYAEAGADCLYAPGVKTAEQIRVLVEAVAPKPLNVLVGWPSELGLNDLAALGVRRVSVGGALAGAAWGGLLRAARQLQQGSFAGFADNAAHPELNHLFE